jgi:hypothetical protein
LFALPILWQFSLTDPIAREQGSHQAYLMSRNLDRFLEVMTPVTLTLNTSSSPSPSSFEPNSSFPYRQGLQLRASQHAIRRLFSANDCPGFLFFAKTISNRTSHDEEALLALPRKFDSGNQD